MLATVRKRCKNPGQLGMVSLSGNVNGSGSVLSET
jgi:hypothetical protein